MAVIRILGIDPGLGITGYGVVEKQGAALTYVASGRIVSNNKDALALRLSTILEGLNQVIESFRPGEVAVEKVFVNVNPNSTLLLGQARGAAICAAVLARLPVAEYTALQVKQSVVGQGHARKEQVQEMVRRLLNLTGAPGTDAADALACAICHAHGGLGAMPALGRRVRAGRIS
jgi:crossover junction endodeoxyribonuclease RuvC